MPNISKHKNCKTLQFATLHKKNLQSRHLFSKTSKPPISPFCFFSKPTIAHYRRQNSNCQNNICIKKIPLLSKSTIATVEVILSLLKKLQHLKNHLIFHRAKHQINTCAQNKKHRQKTYQIQIVFPRKIRET